jgi:hypothetical protein
MRNEHCEIQQKKKSYTFIRNVTSISEQLSLSTLQQATVTDLHIFNVT